MTQPPHRLTHEPPATVADGRGTSCISEIVGDVLCPEGRSGVAYRALRDIVCTGCGGIVAAGELFTRWRLAAASRFSHVRADEPPRLAARCRACVPFAEASIDGSQVERASRTGTGDAESGAPRASARRSPLITNLLDGAGARGATPNTAARREISPEASSVTPAAATGMPVPDSTEDAHEAAYRRLAPALHAGRQSIPRSGAFRKTMPVKRKF